MAYGLSIGHVTDDVTWPPKVLWGSTVGFPSDSLATCLEKALATWHEKTQKSYKCVRMLTALAYTALWNNITDTVYRLQIITKTKHFAVGMNLSMCRMGWWSFYLGFTKSKHFCAKTIFYNIRSRCSRPWPFRQKWIDLRQNKVKMIAVPLYAYRQIHFISENASFCGDNL